jgi:hypothetical protein
MYELKNYYSKSSNSTTKAKFEQLFSEDLKNGLESGEFQKWMEWKFKNVPGSVAQLLINEILVRCHLLHGSLGVTPTTNSNLVQLAFNINELHLGDTALLVLNSGYTESFDVFFNKKSTSEFKKVGDSIYFIPQKVGKYKISATGIDKSQENFDIQVLPMTISGSNGSSKENKIYYFFQGRSSQITSKAITEGSKYKLVGGNWDQVKVSNGKIEFKPMNPGWNVLKLESSSGALYLEDSVFVYPTPQPVVVAFQVSNNKISAKQLDVDGKLTVKVFHPLYRDIQYKVEEMDVNFIGEGLRGLKFYSENIKMDNIQVSKVRFIQVKRIKLSTNASSMILKEPLLIEVI